MQYRDLRDFISGLENAVSSSASRLLCLPSWK